MARTRRMAWAATSRPSPSTRRAISTSPTTATSMCWTPKASSCSRSTTASTAAASAACSPIRSVSCGTTTPPAPRRAPTRTASSSSPSILRRRPGARRSRCRPTSGTSIRATTPTISITRTTTTSMATPSRAIRRTSSLTGWPAMSTPATCMTPGCSPTAASSA